jgi:hypothetical protein
MPKFLDSLLHYNDRYFTTLCWIEDQRNAQRIHEIAIQEYDLGNYDSVRALQITRRIYSRRNEEHAASV